MKFFVTTAATIHAGCLLARNSAEAFAVTGIHGQHSFAASCPNNDGGLHRQGSARSPRCKQQLSRPFTVAMFVLADRKLSEDGVRDSLRDDGVDEEVLFEDDDSAAPNDRLAPPLDPMERAWRHSKKPLLRVGAKGATLSHGNSLRQLLQAHTTVKVKVNTQRFDGDLLAAFENLRALAEESGAPAGIECLQAREKDSIILFGMPGTGEKIAKGEFPPSPLEP